ncbi:MAG: acyl-CoA thioesterase [Candidatus Acidiferrales bacterium]
MRKLMRLHRKQIHVEWGDCDPAGIVYFPRYFEYFDACTNALFESAGLPKPELLRRYGIMGIPLVEAQARYIAPSSFGDTVLVETCITEWKNSSFRVEHKLYRGEILAVEATEVRVWTVRIGSDPKLIESRPIPREVIERFKDS